MDRRYPHMRSVLAVVLCAAALPALGTTFGDRYPAGSIKDRAQAEQALRDADAEQGRLERELKAREAECGKELLVNKCRDDVRRDRLAGERELRRVRVEAHDLQRKLDAEAAARKRSEAGAPPERPAPSAPREAPRSKEIPPEEAARNRAAYEKRQEEKRRQAAEEKARAPERAANVIEYDKKVTEAERRAREKEAERKANEERRAERRKQLEDQEAQREQVRRKAEAAARDAGKP